jgi:SAM-dependent methyltransferase
MKLVLKFHNVSRRLKQLWGSARTKSCLWDAEYAGGRWNHCDSTLDATVYSHVTRYCSNGHILDLGCGAGNTGNELDLGTYTSYVGVDISPVAVQRATKRSADSGRATKNAYCTGDIVSFVPARAYDVILFREAIYYVPFVRLSAVLRRYRGYVRPKGVFIVHVSANGTRRGPAIRKLIEREFEVIETYAPAAADEFVLVFR